MKLINSKILFFLLAFASLPLFTYQAHGITNLVECVSPEVPYLGDCVDPIPACKNPPLNVMPSSCIDKIENGEYIERYNFQCLDGYVRSDKECVKIIPIIIEEEVTAIEQVKCVFYNSNQLQKCYTTDLRHTCSGIGSCLVDDVKRAKGQKLTWKSSCGGYAYTIVDGLSEQAEFKCAEEGIKEIPILSEQVKCIFQNSNQLQKCYTLKGSCSGIETCVMDITGLSGEKTIWKSSCGGYAYTIMDGKDEYAEFKCAEGIFEETTIISEQVKCVFYNSNQLQKCYTLNGSCSGIETCVVDVTGKKANKITWKSSCGGYAYTIMDGESEYAEFKCAEGAVEKIEYPSCLNPPENAMSSSCIDRIENGERIERYKFSCLSGYAKSGDECVRLTVELTEIRKEIPAAGYEDEVITAFYDYDNPFPDTDTSALEGIAAAELYRRAVLGGYPDGEFKGWRAVNRAEAAKFLLLARLGTVSDVRNDGKFRDVLDGQWYVKYVVTAALKGIIEGYSDGTFQPARTVNTAEFLKMLTLNFDLETYLPHSYGDVPDDEWFARYAGIAQKYDLFPDRNAAKLEPARTLTRKEVAIAIYQYLFRK